MTATVSFPDMQTVRNTTASVIGSPKFHYLLGMYLAIVLDAELWWVYFLAFTVLVAHAIVHGVDLL